MSGPSYSDSGGVLRPGVGVFAIDPTTGQALDNSIPAVVTGSTSTTNAGGTVVMGIQQNAGADDLTGTGSSTTGYSQGRSFNHAWDTIAATWSRLKAGKKAGLCTSPYGLPEESWRYASPSGGVESSTADNAIKALDAAKYHMLTDLSVSWGTLSGVTEFMIKDGSTVIFRERLGTAENRFSRSFNRPLIGTINTALVWSLGASVTGKVYVNAGGVSL